MLYAWVTCELSAAKSLGKVIIYCLSEIVYVEVKSSQICVFSAFAALKYCLRLIDES